LRRHDPTSKNRQGADVGEQYRSIILYTDESDRKEMDLYIDKIRPSFSKPILTEVKKLDEFYEAEDYHKNYYENNRFQPYCMLVISPKLSKIRKEFGIKSQD
jgi:Peptide methionine sulfoxide reductase